MLRIETINLNNYVLPDLKASRTGNIILNGDANSFFTYIKDRYNGSPTNRAIINNMTKLLYGNGLIDKTGINIYKYISKRDLKLICQDFYMYGGYALQVIYSQGSKLLKEESKPIRFKYIPYFKIALNVEKSSNEVDGFWYSWDWEEKSKYKPRFYKKFDGIYDAEAPIQIFMCNQTSSNDYWSDPSYLGCLEYCQVEEEMSHSAISHIKNGFSAGKLITIKGGIGGETEEIKQQYASEIKRKLTGSSAKNEPIIAMHDGIDGEEITIQNIEVTALDAQLIYFAEEATRKILMGHSITSPQIMGIPSPSGFTSQADDRVASLNQLYAQTINPFREEIIEGLEELLSFCEPKYSLEFQNTDFGIATEVADDKNNVAE